LVTGGSVTGGLDVNWYDIIQNPQEQAKIYQKIENWLGVKNELER